MFVKTYLFVVNITPRFAESEAIPYELLVITGMIDVEALRSWVFAFF
jgi:hypothetical protein